MKISIIIPVYNGADTIEKCLESVFSQIGAELEIIAVNDGSKDATLSVLAKYSDMIKVVDKENGGVADARNAGLSVASGDFIMFLDADDALKTGCIEKLTEKQREKNADIVRFEYVISGKGGIETKPLHYFSREIFVEKSNFKKEIYPFYIKSIMLNSVCMTLFKREVIEGLTFDTNMKTAEDAVFSLKAYTRAENAVILPDEYYIYNLTEGSITGSGLSLFEKYRCNFRLSFIIIRHLKAWGMMTPYWFFAALSRPVMLTVDKVRRIRLSKKSK